MPSTLPLPLSHLAPIPTWFHVGGRAERLASPASVDDLRRCLELDPHARILGDGANLLVDDADVPELVVSLKQGEFREARFDASAATLSAGAGADFPKLIHESVRLGLAGLEGLVGIPATVGGAAVMNAGGAFGQIADTIHAVHAITREGRVITLPRNQINYSYRHSGLDHLIVTRVDFRLTPADPAKLRERLKECMAYKAKSQPMAEHSAGCAFKNPTLAAPIETIGDAGQRVSAGLLIDRAGCKGLRVGSAEVSQRHANFLTAKPTGKAGDVIDLMIEVQRQVFDRFGVTLRPEVAIWSPREDVARLVAGTP